MAALSQPISGLQARYARELLRRARSGGGERGHGGRGAARQSHSRRRGRGAAQHLASGESRRVGRDVRLSRAVSSRSAGPYMLPERRRLQATMDNPPKATDYIRAKWEVETLRRQVDDAFKDFDLVVMPTQKILPPLLDELIKRAHSNRARESARRLQLRAVQRHGAAGGVVAVRLQQERTADRSHDRRADVLGRQGARGGERLREGDAVASAQAAAHAEHAVPPVISMDDAPSAARAS